MTCTNQITFGPVLFLFESANFRKRQ